VTFRPSLLFHAAAIVIGWAVCLAIALDRVELLFAALPLLVRPMWSNRTTLADVQAFDLTVEAGPRTEGEQLAITITAVIEPHAGPVEILPMLPALLAPLPRATVQLPQPDGAVACEFAPVCQAAGMLDFGAVWFRLWDRSGFWVTEIRKERRVAVAVYPRPTVIRALPAPREPGAPFGLHPSRRLGGGTDFADIRPFVPGDRMRRINWAVSARTGQLHVNEFFAERSATVILLLDSFSEVGGRPNSSLDHCLRAAAGLAMAYLRHHDRVGLMEFGGLLRWTKLGAGPVQYANILHSLARVALAPSFLLQDLAALPETMLPRHALIIALTPLLDERFVRMIVRLADQGRDIVLLAVRGDELSQAYVPRRANDPLIRRLWLLERDTRLRQLRGHGVRVAQWSPLLPIDTALQTVIRPAARRRAA
jgi:uncharacterized protein (DUF58 family)